MTKLQAYFAFCQYTKIILALCNINLRYATQPNLAQTNILSLLCSAPPCSLFDNCLSGYKWLLKRARERLNKFRNPWSSNKLSSMLTEAPRVQKLLALVKHSALGWVKLAQGGKILFSDLIIPLHKKVSGYKHRSKYFMLYTDSTEIVIVID